MNLCYPLECVVLFAGAVSGAAATLKGRFVRNEIGGQRVPGVAVKADGANQTLSDTQFGEFVLQLPAKKAGDRISLSVAKEGLVVVNWIQLEVVLPADPAANVLTLILSREQEREEMARRFFRLKTSDAIEANYRRQLQELEQQKGATAAALARLREEVAQARAGASRASDDLAKVREADTSELYTEAMRLFVEGRTKEAIETLDDAKLKLRAEAARREIEQATEAWLLKGRMLTTQFRFGEAERAYQAAVQNTPSSFDALFAYAYFSASLNHYSVATAQYRRCLELARSQRSPALVASSLNNLANMDRDQNRRDEAREAYDEALIIYRQLALDNPDTYLPNVATTLNNLASLDGEQNRKGQAREAYNEALRIRRRLADANPNTYLPDLTITLNNLANLNVAQNHLDEARKNYDEALKFRRQLASANPGTYLPFVASALNNLAFLDRAQNRLDDARRAYDEALAIYHQLEGANPDTYLPAVAMLLNNLAILDMDQNRRDEARKAFDKALAIYRQLARSDPDSYRPDVAMTLNNLAILDRNQNRIDEARTAYEEALIINRQLARANPDTYQADVAMTLNNMAVLDSEQNRMDEARKAYDEALAIRRELARTNPDTYLPDVATTLLNRGLLEHGQDHSREARKDWEEALQILLPFLERSPGRYDGTAAQIKQLLAGLGK